MSDELREPFSQLQQSSSGKIEDTTTQNFDSSLKVVPESQSKDEKSRGPKGPEGIVALKDRVQELNEIVELEKSRADKVLEEAKSALEEAGNVPQEEREVLEARVKILEEYPVLKTFESALEEARSELKKSEKAWQKQIASPNKSESVKPGAAQLSKEFEELKARYDEMFQVNLGNNDSEQKKDAVLKFDEMSAEFKQDFLDADLEDQKQTLAKAAEISRLEKMSAGFKKRLGIESPKELDDLSEQFSVQVQEVKKLAKEERAQKFGAIKSSSLKKKPLAPIQIDGEGKKRLDSIRKTLSKAKGRVFGANKNLPRKTPQKNSSRGL